MLRFFIRGLRYLGDYCRPLAVWVVSELVLRREVTGYWWKCVMSSFVVYALENGIGGACSMLERDRPPLFQFEYLNVERGSRL
jgi:hypothetical protein